ncbi:hypothetical protein DUI87_14902 [Hirundo rustica rustica]|uniref:Metalloprotease TIKI n=1 Tax=Hirundo rustica rustica TaxID=333673 RepID=A0A3M0KBH6_HIRRU|nr:hypothetical protein DUI87_14902 [Hirundo rustica rustica]
MHHQLLQQEIFVRCEGIKLKKYMVLFALNQTLLQHESLRAGSLQAPYTTEDLIKHYNCGDLNAVIFNHDTSQVPNFINTTLPPHEQVTAQEIDSYFRQELIYKRNERMGRRVMSLLRENRDKSFFFAFGAGVEDGSGACEFASPGADGSERQSTKHFVAQAHVCGSRRWTRISNLLGLPQLDLLNG